MTDIRQVHLADKPRLIELVKVMLGDSNPDEIAAMVVEEFYMYDYYKVFVIEKDNRVEGYGVLKINPFEGADGIAEIVWLGIDVHMKRKGYGQALVKHIENYAVQNGIRKIYIKTGAENKKAVCFWIMQNYKFESRLLNFGFKGHDDYFLGKDIE